MVKLSNWGDGRQTHFCVHCGGSTETRDHAPSNDFLDLPHPDYMPVLPCCDSCNRSFSADEEYLAVFIECAISGSSDPKYVGREKVRKALSRNNALRRRVESRKKEAKTIGGSQLIFWELELIPAKNVFLKLARCHAVYELNEPQLREPTDFLITPLISMSSSERAAFETAPCSNELGILSEVVSRARQRMLVVDNQPFSDWVMVEEVRYRYMASGSHVVTVRGVLSEYMAFEFVWA